MLAPNPRERIGGNQPPGAIELAKPTMEDLNRFLSEHPVIVNDDEARAAKAVADRVLLAFKGMEEERDGKVRPLNEQVAAVNAEYHKWFNTNDKKPGVWGTLLKELKIRLTAYARKLEAERQAVAEAARKAAAEAARKAKEAEDREREAAAEAAAGVCDVDFAGATQEANDAFAQYERAERISERALRETKVRIGGGFGKVMSFRTKEVLIVTDWKAAIEEICGDEDEPPAPIVDAILTCARAYRKVTNQLPAGIHSGTERTL
jgi:hypothetical protein